MNGTNGLTKVHKINTKMKYCMNISTRLLIIVESVSLHIHLINNLGLIANNF